MTEPTSTQSIDTGVRPGDVLAGKYRVEQVLGVGGMGVVVAAHHIQLDEKVALKFLLPSALSNAEAIARFEREARAAVKIKSEHVARVSDVGKLENGSPYMVMEYLAGSDLAGRLEKLGPLPIEEAVEFVLQACEAIAEAHALGIVHRDLKPANLFCIKRADGRLSIKVLDFGISKLTTQGGGQDVSMTRTTAIMGSPLYMSPEQMQSSKRVDARTDIWAIGIILFELVTGRPPFDAEVVTELIIKIATSPPLAVRSLRADVPEGLEQIIMRCLEKSIEARYRNVGELAVALAPFGPKRARASIERILGTMEAAGMSPAASPDGPALQSQAPQAPPPAGSATAAAWGASTGAAATAPSPARRVLVGSAVGAGLLLLVGAAALLTRRGGPPDARPGTTSAAVAPPSAPASVASPPVQAPVRIAPEPESVPTPAPAPATPVHPARAAAEPARTAPAAVGALGAPPSKAAPAPPRAGKVNCDPPYYYDAKGNRAFKTECL
jgi:serine/threonine-protein kinase